MSRFDPALALLISGGYRPSLDLNVLSGPLDPRITFTRASNGSYFDSAGVLQIASTDVPRFDYDPATLAAEGLMIEPQRTNLTLYSAELDNAAWTKTNISVTPNIATAPDGTLSADKIVENTATGLHRLRKDGALGTVCSLSVFMLAAERTFATVFLDGPGIRSTVHVDLTNAVILGEVYNSSTKIASSAKFVGGGYVKVTVSASSAGFIASNVSVANSSVLGSDSGNSYLGDGVSGIHAWGAQLEAGSFPTSYIPTTTASATRAADVATVSLAQPSDILVQDRSGGEWIAGVPAGIYTLAPRTGQTHITRWRAYKAGVAALQPGLAVAYP